MNAAAQGLVRTNYRVRTAAFFYCFVVVGVVLWERGAGPLAWALMALQFLAYPHLVYWRARVSKRPRHAELDNLFLDAMLLGAWCAELGFPTWITYAFISATTLNAVVNRGGQGFAWSLASSAAGAIVWTLVRGPHYIPATSDLVTALCVVGVFLYLSGVGYVVYSQNRRLAASRADLRRSEELYRLIAENAADLIALVDPIGRWLYTSPSYQRILERPDLEHGADAYRKLHPDDAETLRSAVVRTSVSGRARDVAVRLVDKLGRVRQYKTHVQALLGTDTRRVLLVSRDITDLRESEERVLLAAHALEGMTESIVITAADGSIVTVNRAFCELTGFSRDDVLGQSEKVIRNALQPPEYYDDVYATVLRDGYWSGTSWARRKNGSVYREWKSLRAVRAEENGPITHFVMVASEVGNPRSAIDISNPGLNPGLRG